MIPLLGPLLGVVKGAVGAVGTVTGGLLAGPTRWLTLIALVVIVAQALHAGRLKSQLAGCRADHAEFVAAQERAARAVTDQQLRDTRIVAADVATVDTTHQQELDHAHAESERLRADLAAERQRLRQRFTCPPDGRPRLPGAAGATGLADAPAGLRPEDAGVLVGTADACDADIKGLQALVRAYRSACNGGPSS